MEPGELEEVKEVFYAATELAPELRSQFLAESCCGNEDLRTEVARLLAEHDRAGGFLESPFSGALSIRQLALGKQVLEAGQVIAGRYCVVSLLGEGGMGVVYKAEDTRLPRFVALKSLGMALAGDAASLQRLRREAQAASTLNHPNICTIHDVIESEGQTFIVMECLDGQSLKEMIRGTHSYAQQISTQPNAAPLPLETLMKIALQIVEGLEAAHEKGIVHRDIKPANIFITKAGHVKILDFGIAKRSGVFDDAVSFQGAAQSGSNSEARLTTTGVAAGTIGYMSPEQVSATELDTRTDLFSLGAVLYEMATGIMPFREENTNLVIDAILNQAIVPAIRVNPSIPSGLNEILEKCLQKDRDLRYQNASEIRADLQQLNLRLHSATRGGHKFPFNTGKRRVQWILSTAAVAAIAGALYMWRSKPPTVSSVDSASLKAVAVLPFQTVRPDRNTDFLRLALPDEIANTLTYVPSFSIRPFAVTSKYLGPDVDLQKIGREMGVVTVVTGHYRADGDQLEITMEAVDLATNRSVWRDTVTVPATDKIAMREQVTARVIQGLVPMLGGLATNGQGTRPQNEQAYDLYLRSVAIPHDGPLNDEGISLLQEAVRFDPKYAPAWEALGRRYYIRSEYGADGQRLRERSESALERALALDPDLISASAQLILQQAERGELRPAYARATALVQRHPTGALPHFALSYVFRYAGMLQESAHQCDSALALDPGDYRLRACSGTFLQLGNTKRAKDFIRLDAASQYAALQTAGIFLAQGKIADALQATQRMSNSPWMGRALIEPCLVSHNSSKCLQVAQKVEMAASSQADVEFRYANGTLLSYCGQNDAAVRLLRSAIDHGYCAYTHLQTDPMLVKLRGTPEFMELLALARQCQERFVSGL